MVFTPSILGSGPAGYEFLSRTRAAQQEALARSPRIARETAAFVDGLQSVQTIDDLMADRRMLKVALGAFGLAEDIDNRAFIRKVLGSDLSDARSLANRLADKRYLALARAFNFAGESGPGFPGTQEAEDAAQRLAKIRSAEDLLEDASLLRATLRSFGLERDAENTYFLRQVLNSDLTDPTAFANRLSDPRYAELAAAVGLGDRIRQQDSIYGLVDAFAGGAEGLKAADDLLQAPELLERALRIFGLQDDAGRTDFLRSVLDSDLTDAGSFANVQEDPRYAALADVFGFAARAEADADGMAFTSKLEDFIATVSARQVPATTPKELLDDIGLSLAVFDFFDLPIGPDSFPFAHRILTSDRASPTSLLNVFPDRRYRAFADAFAFDPPEAGRVYPTGFADRVVDAYVEREFEARVGEVDPSLRIAISLPRDLVQVVETGTTNDSRWFGVMASRPLRAVFEATFGLPPSFGTLEVDRQLTVLKDRATRMFGTDDVKELSGADQLEDLRRRYLAQSSLAGSTTGTPGTANAVMALLAGAQR